MSKLFSKVDQGQVFEEWKQQKNAVAERLLRDFPWLWAIRSYHSWDDGDFTKVSQDTADLKLVLTQPSDKTRFLIWTITSQPGESFNMKARCLNRLNGDTWAESVMQQTLGCGVEEILYLVVVDPLWGEKHPTRHITIFRHPEKKPMNELVEKVCQLQGSNARWKVLPESFDII